MTDHRQVEACCYRLDCARTQGLLSNSSSVRPNDSIRRWQKLLPAPLRTAGLNMANLTRLYGCRDERNRGCGGINMPCKVSDELIHEAADLGWRPWLVGSGTRAEGAMLSPEDYRLGDIYRWPGQFGPPILPLSRWQPSIGADYHAAAKGSADLVTLRRLVREHPLCRGDEPSNTSCAIHLRLGDVTETGPSTEAVWNGSIVSRYAHPHCYYTSAIAQLRAVHRHVSTIVLVGNMRSVASYLRFRHNVTWQNGAELVERVRQLFARSGYAVKLRLNSSADCDLVYLAKNGCMIPSGGGYSSLAATFAHQWGSVVIRGKPNCSN